MQFCNKAGVNLKKTSCFQGHSSQKEIRKDWRARWQDQAGYHEYYEGEKVISSFWWKASEADWGWSLLSLWKGLWSVSHHLTWGMQMTFYLGVVQAVYFKGYDQGDVILNLLEYYDIVDQIFAVCWDTTSSNTCAFSGVIVLLCTKSWTLPSCGFSAVGTCWHLAAHISHFIGTFTGDKTKAPRGGCVSNFRRSGQQSRMRMTK